MVGVVKPKAGLRIEEVDPGHRQAYRAVHNVTGGKAVETFRM
jgi:hypothetical protein